MLKHWHCDGFAIVSTYASTAQYRAWGAIKSLSYGNSKTLAVAYNGALQPTSYEVPGVLKKSYQYYNDGKLKFTQDQLITNSKYDRSYEYDHVGRVTKALSGAEARGGAANDDRPYNETLTYDAMNHLNWKEAYVWDGYDTTGVQTFVNNRVQGWIYDADGRGLSTSIGYYTYDAAGRVISFGDDDPFKTEQVFNGEGRRAKTVARRFDEGLNDWVTEKITYYLTSTVLGGELITELSEQGAKERTLVRVGGSVLASQVVTTEVSSVVWEHNDPSGASRRTTNASGQIWSGSLELDAVGANAGLAKPITWTIPDKLGLPVIYPEIADMITNPGGGCVADGMSIPCAMVNNNNSLECPDGNCGPRNVYNPLTKKKQLTPLSQNRNNGQLGYWPNGSSGPGVVVGPSGSPTWVTVSTEASSAYVWKWVCYGGQCEFAPEPTAYDGSSYFEQAGFNSHTSSLPQNSGATERALSSDQRSLVWSSLTLAWEALKRDQCRKYAGEGAANAMRTLWDSKRYAYFPGMQGGANRDAAWAETGPGPGWVSRLRTALFYGFFDDGMINDPFTNGATFLGITPDQFRAVVLIHEIRHFLCPGCNYAESHDDDTWNKDIVDYCFK